MKIKLAINWDMDSQTETEVVVDIPQSKCKEIIKQFLMKKDYAPRRDWLKANVPEINLNVPE